MTGVPGSWQNHESFPQNEPNSKTHPYQFSSKPAPRQEAAQPKENYQDMASAGEGFGILLKASLMVWTGKVNDAVELVKRYNQSKGIWVAAFLSLSILSGINEIITSDTFVYGFFVALVGALILYGYAYVYVLAVRRAHKSGGVYATLNQSATSLALGYGVYLWVTIPTYLLTWIFPEQFLSYTSPLIIGTGILDIVGLILAIFAIYRSMLADGPHYTSPLGPLIGYLIGATILIFVTVVVVIFFIVTPLLMALLG